MRIKEYPDIILDTIPRLYESHIKVFITNLYGMEEQVERLPKKFCKMYTTQPLANQLLNYLSPRNANISMHDFHIVNEAKPFTIRLNDGKRLELMLCAGNELGNSLMLLIRRIQGGRLLYYYSAVQQDDLCRLMGNATFMQWIALGTEVLFLNLIAVDQPFNHINYEEVAKEICIYRQDMGHEVVLQLPLFGYEFLVRRLAQTFTLFGHIKLMDSFLDNYSFLTSDLKHFDQPGYVSIAKVCDSSNSEEESPFPLARLKWSPAPNRINLIQLCSLLRPLHIRGIVGYHESGNINLVPDYLKRFKKGYSPKSRQIQIPEILLANEATVDDATDDTAQSYVQTQKISPAKVHKEVTSVKDPYVLNKARKLAFVDDDNDDDS